MLKLSLFDCNEVYFYVTQIVAILQLQEQHKEIVQQEQQHNMVTSKYSHSKILFLFQTVSQ